MYKWSLIGESTVIDRSIGRSIKSINLSISWQHLGTVLRKSRVQSFFQKGLFHERQYSSWVDTLSAQILAFSLAFAWINLSYSLKSNSRCLAPDSMFTKLDLIDLKLDLLFLDVPPLMSLLLVQLESDQVLLPLLVRRPLPLNVLRRGGSSTSICIPMICASQPFALLPTVRPRVGSFF